MSQTTPPGPTAAYPPPQQRRLLRRTSSGRWLGGVGSGFARYLGVDPVLVRVGIIVLALIAGWPIIVLYIACLFVVPADDAPDTYRPHFVDRHAKALAVVAGIVLFLSLARQLDHGPGPWHAPWAVLIGLGILALVWVVRRDHQVGNGAPSGPWLGGPFGGPPLPTDPSADVPPGPAFTHPAAAGAAATTQKVTPTYEYSYSYTYPPSGGAGTTGAGTPDAGMTGAGMTPPIPPTPYPVGAYAAAPSAVFPQPDPNWRPRERSALGPLTVGAALVTAGSLVALDQADALSVPTVVVLASALVVVGLGLLVGAFIGRARGLIVLGIVLSIVTAVAGVVHLPASNSVGDQSWRPLTVGEVAPTYEWGIGDVELDLGAVSAPAPVVTSVNLGVGDLRITVPRDATVRLHAEVGAGVIDTIDAAGTVTSVEGINREVTTTLAPPSPEPGATTFDLDVSVGIGHVEVNRA